MMNLLERCRCGTHLSLWEDGGRWHVACLDRCYDPAEDAGPIASLVGRGDTPGDALDDYMRLREDADLEPVYTPTDIATFVVPRCPEGWAFTVGTTAFYSNVRDAHRIADGVGHSQNLPIYYGPIEGQKAANQ